VNRRGRPKDKDSGGDIDRVTLGKFFLWLGDYDVAVARELYRHATEPSINNSGRLTIGEIREQFQASNNEKKEAL
jgi:hypothetical protein